MQQKCVNKVALLDHLVGACKQRHGRIETQRLDSLEIDDNLEFRGLLDRKITRLFSLEDAIDIRRGAPVKIVEFNTV